MTDQQFIIYVTIAVLIIGLALSAFHRDAVGIVYCAVLLAVMTLIVDRQHKHNT